jgi:hypothetical protein
MLVFCLSGRVYFVRKYTANIGSHTFTMLHAGGMAVKLRCTERGNIAMYTALVLATGLRNQK